MYMSCVEWGEGVGVCTEGDESDKHATRREDSISICPQV